MSKHFTALADLSSSHIEALLDRAKYFQNSQPSQVSQVLAHRVVANLFFEPSTRTRTSFEVAAKRLGAHVVNFDVANSSVKKGESLYDTLRTMEAIGADALVVRHADERVFETHAPRIATPMINAGAGKHEHPSQCLLDLYTLREEFGRLPGLTVAIVGDVKHSRVAGSMLLVAQKLGLRVRVAGPSEFLPTTLPANCERTDLDEALAASDAVMCLRNQFERHEGLELSPAAYFRDWGITAERVARMRPGAIIMHPAPVNRGIEIADELVESPRSRIFKQMHNGVYARMAILEWALQGETK